MRQRRSAGLVMIAVLVSLAGVAAACGGTTSPTGDSGGGPAPVAKTPVPGGKLVVATAAEADGFNPTINRWASSTLMIARTVFDPLTAFDEKGQPQPYLADSFTPNATFTEWVIKLRPDITFHNGERLDSTALLLDLEKLKISPVTGSVFKSVAGYEKVDDLSVKATLTAPWAQYPAVFASQTGFVAAPAQLNANDSVAPIGTGPFTFKEWKQNEKYVGTKNASYWRKDKAGAALPYLDEVQFQPTTDPQRRTSGINNGDFNMIQTESAGEVTEYAQTAKAGNTGDVRVLLDEGEGSEATLVLNNQTGPFTDKGLRVAAAKSIDRKKLVDSLFKGYYKVADGPFSASSVWGGPQQPVGYDLPGAIKLVDEYKAAHGGQKPAAIITVADSTDNVAVGQYIQQSWNDAGFDAKVETSDEKGITVKVVTGSYDAMFYPFWDRPDPDGMAHYWSGANTGEPGTIGLNFARFKSKVVDDALAEGRAITDEKKRIDIYKRVWNDFAENQYIVWLYHTQWVIAYGKNVQGVGDFTLPGGQKSIPIAWGNLFITGVWLER